MPPAPCLRRRGVSGDLAAVVGRLALKVCGGLAAAVCMQAQHIGARIVAADVQILPLAALLATLSPAAVRPLGRVRLPGLCLLCASGQSSGRILGLMRGG